MIDITLDEAIAHAREVAKKRMQEYEKHYDKDAHYYPRQCKKCAVEHEQLAQWLEELKDYRDKNKMVIRVDVENMDSIKDKIDELSKYAESQYNKAIDDLSNKICMHFADWQYSEEDKCIKDIIELASESVDEIAEQLKEGVKNE